MPDRSREPKSDNITWHAGSVDRAARREVLGHGACLVWLTGLSGSGKSTVARAVEAQLTQRGCHAYVIDGDNVRHGLCRDLGFSAEDRRENIRRIGEVAKLFVDAGAITITAFISPYRADRDAVRAAQARHEDFIEVYVDCPLAECERRDPKGLYARARAGEIASFTGISAPYEPPLTPELVVDTSAQSVDASAAAVVELLARRGVLPRGPSTAQSPRSKR